MLGGDDNIGGERVTSRKLEICRFTGDKVPLLPPFRRSPDREYIYA
jgi:hypothetical protein